MKTGHFHTGIVSFVFAGVAAIVVMNVVAIGAAHLVQNDRTERVGRVLGALVTPHA